MDDFLVEALMYLAILLFIGAAILFGSSATESSIINQCEDFDSFSIGDNVYQCTLIRNKQK